MRDLDAYPFEMRRLSPGEGGGWLIAYPDFSECIADGATVEEAIAEGREALAAVIATLEEKGYPIPDPGGPEAFSSGKFMTRVPKSTHARLARRAKQEGVSLNALVLSFIAEGLGRKDIPEKSKHGP
jgi:antitoxin HicB